jgi:hypothetical protein
VQVRQTLRLPCFAAAFAGVFMLAGPALAQTVTSGALSQVPLPGGLRASLAVIGDHVPGDRSQFLLEFIRRLHNLPPSVRNTPRDSALRVIAAHLQAASQSGTAGTASETLPLPLTPEIWSQAVFKGRETPQTLVAAILRDRGAALLYYGLLSLDDGTRAWLASRPDLITELTRDHAAAFVLAAPGIHVSAGRVLTPGGPAAQRVWEEVAGKQASEPAAFLRAVLTQSEGRLAYAYGAMGHLTPEQVRFALGVDGDPPQADRAGAGRRLLTGFERVAEGWRIDERVFWRPTLDPALLIADLRTDAAGRPVLPGSRRFWTAVFRDGAAPESASGEAAASDPGVDFAWLCEQIFTSDRGEHRDRYQLAQFAIRLAPHASNQSLRDAVEVVRALEKYPALVTVLERARLTDVAAFAAAVRRAAEISGIEDDGRAARALAQYQGALALLARAAVRGSMPPAKLAALVSSLAAIEVDARRDYDGRIVRWLDGFLQQPGESSNGSAPDVENAADDGVVRLVAGGGNGEPRYVEWEGTRYRVDLGSAEVARISKLLGEQSRPYLSSARELAEIAAALDVAPGRDRIRQAAAPLKDVAAAAGLDDEETWDRTDVPRRYRDAAAMLQRADGVETARRAAAALRVLADDLLARGLSELAYAVALGQRASISADDAATRHDFGLHSPLGRRAAPWRLPAPGGDSSSGWRMTGALLGLDVRLADYSLVRLSSRPPPRRPTLEDDHRRGIVETSALISPTLSDADRDAIVAAMAKGRAKLMALETPAEAAAVADEIRLGPARRTLLPWVTAHDRERLAAFLSPNELLWLGLEAKRLEERFDLWGAAAEARLGCLCMRLLDRRPWESLAGRWHSGVLVSAFADLNLRVAELLAELRMPAALLGPVLAAATQDFVDSATVRDHDDRRGMVEFVQALRIDRVEQYLALLTTEGPLVPVANGSTPPPVPPASGAR